jgi:dTDP-4-amino-4,6-dideoxygalactose transaminase
MHLIRYLNMKKIMKNKIYVTKPSLPSLDDLNLLLKDIWNSKIVTNNGPYTIKLTKLLEKKLSVDNLLLTSNGTLSLLLAIKSLELKGEVITTPFSFIATASSLSFLNLKPIFVDIDSKTLNIDVTKIEKSITKNTSAIMATHSYGNPCDYVKINEIAKKYNLKVIYDAASSFFVNDNNGSILNHGDISILSFHATKTFSTIEGGAIICKSKKIYEKIKKMINFGFVSEYDVEEIGINGKINEIQSAIGILNLKKISKDISKRKKIHVHYKRSLKGLSEIHIYEYNKFVKPNYNYFPIILKSKRMTKALKEYLNTFKIFPRRYFYPIISDYSVYQKNSEKINTLHTSKDISSRILCLPIYSELIQEEQDFIINKIKLFFNK